MTLLGHDVHARDTINVQVLVWVDGTLLDHLCKLLKVLKHGDGDGVDIGALVNHELGALWMPPRGSKHDGHAARMGREVAVCNKLLPAHDLLLQPPSAVPICHLRAAH
jgi:hypothetical protein